MLDVRAQTKMKENIDGKFKLSYFVWGGKELFSPHCKAGGNLATF